MKDSTEPGSPVENNIQIPTLLSIILLGGVALTVTEGHYSSAIHCSVDKAEVQDPVPPRRIRFDRARSNDLCCVSQGTSRRHEERWKFSRVVG